MEKNNTLSNSSNKSIILFDQSSNLQELLKTINQKKNFLIVTFDYDSHKTLYNQKIPHKISDDFINEIDLKTIQKTSYELMKWCEENPVKTLLNYQGVNTGKLFNVEFHYFLIPFLKKFVEIMKIYEIFRDSHYIASSILYKIISTFTTSVSILEEDDNKYMFLYDSIKFDFNLGKKSISLRIPRSYYLSLKKISEKIINVFFSPRAEFENDKSVLFVEFDTIRYEKIFSTLPKKSINAISFCRRRPVIWNLKSFLIMKNSNCSIANYYTLYDKNLKNSINVGLNKMGHAIESLFTNDDYFSSFFIINQISFWNVIKPFFMELSKKRITEAVSEIELTMRLLKKYKIKSIVIWNENGFNEQIIMGIAKLHEVPIILFQHGGIAYDTAEAYDYNCFAGILPIYSDKFIVWGDVLKRYAISCGISEEKIKVLGSPLYDKIFERRDNDSIRKEEFVLLTTSSHIQNFVTNHTVRTREIYEQSIKAICQTVLKMGKKLVIKLHPFQEEIDITKIAKKVDATIEIVKHGDIFPLLESCEILLTIDVSSTVLEAQILKKPTISISVKDFGFGNPELFRSNSCILTDRDGLPNVLNQIQKDTDYKKCLIENGDKFVNDSLANQGTATENLLAFLEMYE